jgi:hypothetical protein
MRHVFSFQDYRYRPASQILNWFGGNGIEPGWRDSHPPFTAAERNLSVA